MWREPETITAVGAYLRLAIGAAFMGLLIYLVAANRLDVLLMLKIISGLSAVFHIGVGVSRLAAQSQPPTPPPPSNPRSDLLHWQ